MGLNITKDKIVPNKWHLDVRVMKGCKEKRQRKVFTGTKREAEDKYIELRQAIIDGIDHLPQTKTEYFKDLMFLYRDKRNGIPKKELARYNTLLNDLGNWTLIKFADKFEGYLKFFKQSYAPTTGKVRSLSTINRYVALVKACFNMAVERDIIEKNPITRYRFPKYKETPRDVVLNDMQIENLYSIISELAPHILPIVTFAMQMPSRKSELINMKTSDLDLIKNRIRIRNGTNKSKKGHWKAIPPNMTGYFRTLPKGCEYLFYRENIGTHYRKNRSQFSSIGDFKYVWSKCRKKANLPELIFHDSRHISASRAVDEGTAERIVMMNAGWVTNMLEVYYNRNSETAPNLFKFSKENNEAVHQTYTSEAKQG